MTAKPPDRLFGWGPPEDPTFWDAGMRPICERINETGWLWTAESCEGHGDGSAWDHPMVRFVCHTTHVGHLLILLKEATNGLQCSTPVVYPGYAPDAEWSDVLTYIEGDDSQAERLQRYARLAELAHRKPPAT